METEPSEFIQSSWLGKQRLSKIVDLSSLPVNNDNNNNNNNDNNKHMGGAVGLFVMYGSWNCPPRDNAGLLRLFYAMLFPQRREEDDVKYVTGMVQVDECEDELDACCGDDDGTTTPSSSLLPCPPSSLPAALLILRKSSMKQPEIRYLSSLSSSEILKYWKDSVAPIPESILVEIQQTLRSFGMLQSTIPSFGLSSLLEKQPPSPALRIFIAGDRMSVGKTSVCLGLLANLVSKGYHPRELAYIKPATQNEKPQLVQKYCEYLGIPCIPIGPVVYYRGFTRAFLAGETEPSHELLQKVEVAVDALAHNKKVVIVDGVGHPAVGSICGTDNASVARASGYPSSTEDKQQQQQCRRQPPGVLVVGGSGVGGAVDAFNLNATYFERVHVPVLGAIFNKLSLDGFYSLENCKTAVSHYFGQNPHQLQHGRQAFGFVPLHDGIASGNGDDYNNDSTMRRHIEDFGRIFGEHVDIDGILKAAKQIQDQSFPRPMETSSDEDGGERTSLSTPPPPPPFTAKRQKVVRLSGTTRSRAEIEDAAIQAGAAPSA